MNPIPRTSSAPSKQPVALVPSTSIKPNHPTGSQAPTLNPPNVDMNPLPQTRSHQPVMTVPSPLGSDASTPRKLRFWPAERSFHGCVSEPKGKPSCLGGYSDVWRCKIWFSTPSEAFPNEVAVKVLRSVGLGDCASPDTREVLLQRFEAEAIVWVGLVHPNIVPLIGWTLKPHLSLISPWQEQGDLSHHLESLSEIQKVQLLLGIAKGLEYLHSRNPPVVHGDIKPENILLSDQGEPLLTDFGLSAILEDEMMYSASRSMGGSTPWMSPECMLGEPGSRQSDVYSFGNLAFTIMTRTLPHAGLTPNQITLRVCNSEDPKDPVDDWNKYPQLEGLIKDLLKDCWSRSPDARPSMLVVVQRLTTLLESHEPGIHAVSSPGEPEAKIGLRFISPFILLVIFIGMVLCTWAIQEHHHRFYCHHT